MALSHQAYLSEKKHYMVLKISLIDYFSPDKLLGGRLNSKPNLSSRHLQALNDYAQGEEGIYRLILVPATLDLRALHYIIQRAFGFYNRYPHQFVLSPKLFRLYGGIDYNIYCQLAGILYRYPISLPGDQDWDRSILDAKSDQLSYFRNHYKEGKRNAMVGETFVQVKQAIDLDPLRPLPAGLPWYRPWKQIGSVYELLERLSLPELLTLYPSDLALFEKSPQAWLEIMEEKIAQVIHNWNDLPVLTRQHLLKMAKELIQKRALVQEAKEKEPQDFKTILELENQAKERQYWPELLFSTHLNPSLIPFTNRIYYRYGYDDDKRLGWCFEIELMDELICLSSKQVISRFGKAIKEEYAQKAQALNQEHQVYPICLQAKGANPMENARSLSKWIEFLQDFFDEEGPLPLEQWPRTLRTPSLQTMF